MEPGLAPDLLSSIPFDPQPARRPATAVWAEARAGMDFITHNLPKAHRVLVRMNPYPRPWRHVRLTMPDGARLAAWHVAGKPGRGAVLMVPGTFQTKDDAPRKRRALDLWRRLGLHMLVVDMRGFGGSHRHLPSAGRDESRDIHAAADWLRQRSGAPRVTLWGESLGGAMALLAGTLPGAEERFDRILAWSPFADLADAALASSPDHPRGRTSLGRTYRWLLRRRDARARDFRDFLALRARELGVKVDELMHGGSPCYHMERLRVPATVLHAEDDPVVPVEHARRLAACASPNLRVHVLPTGRHLAFDLDAPAWYKQATARLLGGRAA